MISIPVKEEKHALLTTRTEFIRIANHHEEPPATLREPQDTPIIPSEVTANQSPVQRDHTATSV